MLKSGLEKAGTPLDDFDLILAACALANDLVLVTNNVKHDGAQRFIIRPNVQMVRSSPKLALVHIVVREGGTLFVTAFGTFLHYRRQQLPFHFKL